ncbi:MAG: 50S ribosomal protein L24e [Promethearchaeota archaeon]
MVKVRKCSFCGKAIQPGEGLTLIKNDGTILHFCSKKCRLLKLKYKKNPRKTRWTTYYGEE